MEEQATIQPQSTNQPQQTSATPTLVYATFLERLVAMVIDSLFVLVITFVIGAVLGAAGSALGGDGLLETDLVARMFGNVVVWCYFVFFTGSQQTTPGKKLLKLKVVKTDGSNVTYVDAFIREVVGKFVSSIILLIGYFWMLWDPNKQCLHDKIAKTYVVKAY